MVEPGQTPEVEVEGSARVLSEVKGRLERMETGELPVIQRVGPDGSVRQVDPTGEMVRPATTDIDAINAAAEAFAAEHRVAGPGPAAAPAPVPAPEPVPVHAPEPTPTGLWARIRAWFGRSGQVS